MKTGNTEDIYVTLNKSKDSCNIKNKESVYKKFKNEINFRINEKIAILTTKQLDILNCLKENLDMIQNTESAIAIARNINVNVSTLTLALNKIDFVNYGYFREILEEYLNDNNVYLTHSDEFLDDNIKSKRFNKNDGLQDLFNDDNSIIEELEDLFNNSSEDNIEDLFKISCEEDNECLNEDSYTKMLDNDKNLLIRQEISEIINLFNRRDFKNSKERFINMQRKEDVFNVIAYDENLYPMLVLSIIWNDFNKFMLNSLIKEVLNKSNLPEALFINSYYNALMINLYDGTDKLPINEFNRLALNFKFQSIDMYNGIRFSIKNNNFIETKNIEILNDNLYENKFKLEKIIGFIMCKDRFGKNKYVKVPLIKDNMSLKFYIEESTLNTLKVKSYHINMNC